MAVVRLAIRDLVEFSEQRGDINFRFSSRSSALAGIRGHQRLQQRRGDDYVAEAPVNDSVDAGDFELLISGRADGYWPAASPLIVEEIKTVRGDATQIPGSIRHLHFAQACAYGWLLGREAGVSQVEVRVCYLQLDDDSEVIVRELMDISVLRAKYEAMVQRYCDWESRRQAWLTRRNRDIDQLKVPFGGFRAGQREMAVSVWRALRDGTEAFIQAPTGIGKTMASLYPSIRALSSAGFDKVFFLTAKGPGQAAAQEAISTLRQDGLKLTDVTLTAREKACFNPGVPCHPEHCAYAAGYYDRLPDVLSSQLGQARRFTAQDIRELAQEKGMCPFELGLDLATIADVVICDYNYAFDPWVHLRRFFSVGKGRYAFLVDEAHNLVDRGRDMFSASLDKDAALALRRRLKPSAPLIASRLSSINTAILKIRREASDALEQRQFAAIDELPAGLLKALRRFCESAEAVLSEDVDDGLLQYYFDALRFARTAELIDDDFRCLIDTTGGQTVLKIVAVNPHRGLRAGFERAAASISFSATLTPQPYFRRLIGAGERADWFRLPSPFPSGQLGVFVSGHIGTTWRERSGSLDELADTIAAVVANRQGNYLVFFPSHRYLADAMQRFQARHPDVDVISQAPAMNAEARAGFVAAFDAARDSTLVGFAVTGGMFGEGVDLQGDRLIGVVVVGVGLPAISPERELIGDYFREVSDSQVAWRFAYQYPGLNRVLQTAGRVIRSSTDRGVVCLIDGRFNEDRYASLLPEEWRITRTPTRHALAASVSAFWNDDETCVSRPDSLHDNLP